MSNAPVYFCFCLPSTLEDVKNDVNANIKDFVITTMQETRILDPTEFWNFYKGQVWTLYDMLKRKFEGAGISFIPNCTIEKFRSLLYSPNNTIVLFSHCKNGGTDDEHIEFFDGMLKFDRIGPMIPDSFEGIIDFSVCKPNRLAGVLEIPTQPYVVFYWGCKIDLAGMLAFYDRVFSDMARSNCTFIKSYKNNFKSIM